MLVSETSLSDIYPEPLNSLEQADIGFLQRVSARETLLGLKTVRQVGGMPFVPLRAHTVWARSRVMVCGKTDRARRTRRSSASSSR